MYDSTNSFPKYQLTDELMKRLSCRFCRNQLLFVLIDKHNKPLPPAKMITPSGTDLWIAEKTRAEVMLHLLKHDITQSKCDNATEMLITCLVFVCVANAFDVSKVLGVNESNLSANYVPLKGIKERRDEKDEKIMHVCPSWLINNPRLDRGYI